MLCSMIASSRTASLRILQKAHLRFPSYMPNLNRILSSGEIFKFNRYIASYTNQSIILPGAERARASTLTDDPKTFVADVPNTTLKTVYEVLDYGQKNSNYGDCAGIQDEKTGEFHWIKYSEFIERTQHVGSALIYNGQKPCTETFIGIFSSNYIEFMLTLFGCAGYSMVMVPLYATLGTESVIHIVNEAALQVVVCDTNKNALTILKHISRLPSLKTVIIMENPSDEVFTAAQTAEIKFQTFKEFEADGKRNKKELVLPKADDLFCIPYTSGTTGNPKGVMLTHRNAMSCVSSLVLGYGPAGKFGGTIVSYLPPAHIYEIMNEVASMYFGRRMAFFNGEIKNLFQYIYDLKPTVIPLVPRLLNLLYSKANEEIKSVAWKRYMLKWALSRKEKLIKRGIITSNTIWDKLLFKNLRDCLGGNFHIITTTSAPISPEVMKFFRCAAGCYIFEAYGQTEVLAGSMTLPYEYDGGSVGPPLPCNHMKLVDVPEMDYFSKNDVGEICFKGVNVFQGYFKNQKATEESIDKDGWHHSGDIGRWLPNGTLQIIDRRKHLFKLSQGEYIAPEKVENVYGRCKLVLQIYVDGLTTENFIVAIVFPEPVAFSQWVKKMGFDKKSHSELLMDKDVRQNFLKELHKIGRKEDLNALEQAKNIYLISEPFTVENELLTPTLKLKRNKARKHYESVFADLYKEGPLISSSKAI